MALTDKQMEHPKFMAFSAIANDMLGLALQRSGLDLTEQMRPQADRLVDDFTALLIRAAKAEGR